MAVDDQVRRLDEGGFLGKFFDGNAAVTQDAFIAVNESDFADAGAGIAVAFI